MQLIINALEGTFSDGFKGLTIKTDEALLSFLVSDIDSCEILIKPEDGGLSPDEVKNAEIVSIFRVLPSYKKFNKLCGKIENFPLKSAEFITICTTEGNLELAFVNARPHDRSICKFPEFKNGKVEEREIAL